MPIQSAGTMETPSVMHEINAENWSWQLEFGEFVEKRATLFITFHFGIGVHKDDRGYRFRGRHVNTGG